MRLAALVVAASLGASGACLDVRSDRITAADLARAVPAFERVAPETVISYAPVPGHTRVFRRAELQQRLHAGADLPDAVCFEWRMRTPERAEIREIMIAALPPGSEVEVLESPSWPVPEGPLQFPLSGLLNSTQQQRIWRGFIEYVPGRRYDVQARVVVRSPFRRVVPVRPIRAGERITADLIRVESGIGVPPGPGFATDTEQVAGQTSRRLLPADASIPLASLQRTATVARGDSLQVDVISGQARIRFDGIAQAPAGRGELVPIRMRDTGRIIHARVNGEGRAVLDLNTPERQKL